MFFALFLTACGSASNTASGTDQQAESAPSESTSSESTASESVASESDESNPETTTTPSEAASESSESESDEQAQEAPTFAAPEELTGLLQSTTGEQVNLENLRGQDVVLWFWAPW